MRVLYFTRGYTAHDHRFLAKLAQTGNEIGYLRLMPADAAEDPHPLPDGIRRLSLGNPSRRLAWRDYPGLVRSVRKALEAFGPQVVHAGPVQDCALLAAWAGANPLVTMSWGSDILTGARQGLGRLAARFVLSRTTVFVCDCQAVRQAGLALGAPAERVVVFPWGVDLKHFCPGDGSALRRRLGWGDAFVLLSTRSWEPAYGVETLVAGFVRLAAQVPSLRLMILGSGSQGPRLRELLTRAGLLERVHFAGSVALEDLPPYYCAADLYLTASRSDGSSVSLLEAMACGLPAVVSDTPGNREWVSPEENGWWFAPGDARALTDVLGSAIEARDRLPGMGRCARAIAEARADWDRNFPRLLEAYRMAADAGGAR